MRWGVFAPTPLWPTPGGHQETGWEEGNRGITAAGVIEIKGSRAPHKVLRSLTNYPVGEADMGDRGTKLGCAELSTSW